MAVWAARCAALGFGPLDTIVAQPRGLTALLTPEAFYAQRDWGRQAMALALLDGLGRLRFAIACGAALEAWYGIAVPGLVVLEVWHRAGLLDATVVVRDED